MNKTRSTLNILLFYGYYKKFEILNILNQKFREGVSLVPGGKFGHGRIIMTKIVYERIFESFFVDLLEALRFPGILSVDAHGFVQTSTGEPVFIFGSLNSAIRLWNEKQSVFLERKWGKKIFFVIKNCVF